MKFKEKISIDEFDGKRFQIRLIEPDNNKKAVLTHYLHNINNGVSQHYKEDALIALEELISYKQEEENFSYAADIALQQLLFEVENVPFPTPKNYSFKIAHLGVSLSGRAFRYNLFGEGKSPKRIFTTIPNA